MINLMMKFFHRQLSTIERFLSKLPGFSNPQKHSINFMNSAQFLGALNDNIYKFTVVFFLIKLEGAENANYILSAAGALFVIPFLLFSSMAGILADRYSKSRLVIIIKAAEIVIMLFAILAFGLHLKWGTYALLFLLSMQSAMFGPSKYGIIPELVSKTKVSKANGLITSFTYLAIIIGTFLAPFLTEITDYNFILVGIFCLVVAIIGFISSFGIKYTPPVGTKKKINFFFIQQIAQTLRKCHKQSHLLLAIVGSAYFLFMGAFTQLNIIPFAMQSLGLSELAGGYLFLASALGIALGAALAGRASRRRVELGLACIAEVLIACFLFLLSFSAGNLILSVIALFLLGLAGGNFVVPIDTFIQLYSPESDRGHVIAAANFLSFVGVLFASLAIFLFNEILGFTAAGSFAIIGGITILFSLFMIVRLSSFFLSYTARKFLSKIIPIKAEGLEMVKKAKKPLLMIEHGSFIRAWLLCTYLPNLNILVPQYKTRRFPWFEKVFYSIHRIDSPQKFEALVSHGKRFVEEDMIPCFYLPKKKPVPEKQTLSFQAIFSRKSFEVITVNFHKPEKGKITHIQFSKE
ncbi:MAG: Lysophospholipid transporter LplT [Chlamydiae bacterium]|nr:Lysophospholipid transporter LplT [Chlamydiota bacterium]